jgi:hypothetical protein
MDETKVGSEVGQNWLNMVRGLQACRCGMRLPLDLTVGMGKIEKILPGVKVGLKNCQYPEQLTEKFVLQRTIPLHSNRHNLDRKRKAMIRQQELNRTRR